MPDGAKQGTGDATAGSKTPWVGTLGDRLRHYMHGEMTPMPVKILMALLQLQRLEAAPRKEDGEQRK